MISRTRVPAAARMLARGLGRPAGGRRGGPGSGLRLGAAVIGLAAAALLPAVTGAAAANQPRHSRLNEPTISQDNLRTGWDPNEPTLTARNVAGRTPGYRFGQVFKTAVTGQVYAQPLVIGSTVIVATEDDYVYGLNAATGAVKWTTHLGTPYAITTCTDLSPDVGVTAGTRVYDPTNGNLFMPRPGRAGVRSGLRNVRD